jgi:hypothetical protein
LKLVKVPILVLGAAGLTLTLVELDALRASFDQAPLHTILVLAGWALPAAMGLLAIVRPPLRPWQASASLAGFAVVAIRTRIWSALPSFPDASLEGQLQVVALLGGLVASLIAVVRPEGGS